MCEAIKTWIHFWRLKKYHFLYKIWNSGSKLSLSCWEIPFWVSGHFIIATQM